MNLLIPNLKRRKTHIPSFNWKSISPWLEISTVYMLGMGAGQDWVPLPYQFCVEIKNFFVPETIHLAILRNCNNGPFLSILLGNKD